MPRAKISEFSTTAGDNTDIDGINIGEGCAPSGINDAIRELMAQLKDFQSGAAGDNITVVGTLAAKGTSSSGADLKLYEDTDNGTNYVGFIAPASIASNVQWTLPSADGSSGQALQTNGSGTLSFATLGISAGGTGQTTANAAFNALAPSQTSNAGRYLKTDGTNTSWDLLDISTADITGTLPVANGGTGITSFGTGVATALGINVGSSGAFVTNGGALGTPSSGTVTNLTGTASININGTVGATTPNTGSFTTLTTSSTVTINGGTANGVAYLNGSKVLTTGSALVFDGSNLGLGVTPSAWGSTWRVLDAGNLSSFANNTGSSVTDIWHNAFVNSGGVLTYKTTAAAGFYRLEGGTFKWFKASSGTAGTTATFTQVMTLDADGDLGIGTTSPGQKLTVQGGINVTSSATLPVAQGSMLFSYEAPISRIYMGDGTGYSFAFSKRASSTTTDLMTLTDGGNFSLGGTANRGTTVGTNALQIFNGTAPAGTLTNGVSLYSSSGDLFFMDAAGNASRVGFRGVPQSGSAKTGSYTLATSDVGDYIQVGSGGSITIPDATFATGDVVSIFNNTTGNITITCSITTAYIAGTDSDKATMTLATRGVATVLFISSTICVVTGNVT